MEVAVTTDVGIGQRLNDDGWCAEQLHRNVTLLAVADGFGRPRGSPASQVVLDAIKEMVRRELRRATFPPRSLTGSDIRELLVSAFAHANERLLHLGGGSDDYVASGSTCTLVLVVSNQAFIAHVGDSRAYLMRRGEVVQLTTDESILTGVPQSVRGKGAPARHVTVRPLLTRALGIEPASAVPPKVTHYTLQPHDALMLCTDGTYRGLALGDIQTTLLAKEAPEWCTDRLVALARASGGTDNATIVLARDATVHGAQAEHRQKPRRTPRSFVALAGAVAIIWATALALAWSEDDSHLYLGADDRGTVSLYAGSLSIFGIPLRRVKHHYVVSVKSLGDTAREALNAGIPVSSVDAATELVAKWQTRPRR